MASTYQAVNSQCSNIELKLSSVIHELKNISEGQEDVQKLVKDARELLNQLRAKIQILQVFCRETNGEDETEEIQRMIEWHETQLKELLTSYQRANLMAKTKMDDFNRHNLLKSSMSIEEQQSLRRRKNQGASIEASSAVTESLLELRQKLATGLTLSESTMGTLVNSSNVLSNSKDEMTNIESHVSLSSRLITKFSRREVVDKFLIMAGMVLFFSVVLYILKKRLIGELNWVISWFW